MNILIAGLDGALIYCSASLLALSSVTYHYNGSLGVQNVQKILELACALIVGSTREIALSALSFIKVYLSVIPTPTIAPMLIQIVKSLTSMTDDCKRHFRQKVRDIMVKLMRRFGADIITSIVPASDRIMHQRLKNIRKVECRKQKLKEERRADENDESGEEFYFRRQPKSLEEILADSDQELSDSDDESTKAHKRKSKKKAWIQESEENIVDFADPTAVKNISATKPSKTKTINLKNKSKDRGFKTAPDGRLIIDNSDDESDDGKNKKKKNKLPFLDGNSDGADDGDMKSTKSSKSAGFVNRKRKLSATDAESVVSDSKSSSSKYQAGGSGIHRPLKLRKKENDPGEQYRANKAFGDIKRKGKPDPYVYIPLKRSSLNKRNRIRNDPFKSVLSRSKKDKHLRKNARNKKK